MKTRNRLTYSALHYHREAEVSYILQWIKVKILYHTSKTHNLHRIFITIRLCGNIDFFQNSNVYKNGNTIKTIENLNVSGNPPQKKNNNNNKGQVGI